MITAPGDSKCGGHSRLRAAGVLLAAALLLGACSTTGDLAIRRHANREKALVLIDEAQRLENEGSLLMALERYDRAAHLYACPEAYFKEGQVFEAQGKTEAAATAYNKALELAPDFQEARLSALALGYKPQNATPTPEELARAQAWGQQRNAQLAALRAKMPTADTTTTVADIKGQRLEVIEAAVQKRLPTTAEVSSVLFAPEAGEARQLSATSPVYANEQDIILATYPYHYQKAVALKNRQLYDRAADEYERALQADPKKIQARLELADMLMSKMNRSDRARVHYERAITDFPADPQAYTKMGRYYSDLKQPDRAREFYHKALEKDPKYIDALNNLAVMDMVDKKLAQASQEFDEIIKINPSYANAYLNRGIIAEENEKNKDLALRCYKRYVELGGSRKSEVSRWITSLESER